MMLAVSLTVASLLPSGLSMDFYRGGDDLARNSAGYNLRDPAHEEPTNLPEIHLTAKEPVTVTPTKVGESGALKVEMQIILTGDHDTTGAAEQFFLLHAETKSAVAYELVELTTALEAQGFYGAVGTEATIIPTDAQRKAGKVVLFVTSDAEDFVPASQTEKAKQLLTITFDPKTLTVWDLDLYENPKASGGHGAGGANAKVISKDAKKYVPWRADLYDAGYEILQLPATLKLIEELGLDALTSDFDAELIADLRDAVASGDLVPATSGIAYQVTGESVTLRAGRDFVFTRNVAYWSGFLQEKGFPTF